MKKKVRAHVWIVGRVQGVCYRMETKRAAERYGVNGWVKNRNDGSVEALMEGDEGAVQLLIQWCKQGPTHAVVHHVDVEWEDVVDEFTRFEITY